VNLSQRRRRDEWIPHARLQDIAFKVDALALDGHARHQLIGVFGMRQFHIHARLINLDIFGDDRQQVFFNAVQQIGSQLQPIMHQHQRQALARHFAGRGRGWFLAPKEFIKQSHSLIPSRT
jgi:hypothetical protein